MRKRPDAHTRRRPAHQPTLFETQTAGYDTAAVTTEITASLEGAVRLLAHSLAGGDVIDPELCQTGAIRLIDRALRFVEVAA